MEHVIRKFLQINPPPVLLQTMITLSHYDSHWASLASTWKVSVGTSTT
jgi:hypothetical protein